MSTDAINTRRRGLGSLRVFHAALFAPFLLLAGVMAANASTVVSSLPASFSPGVSFTVTNLASPDLFVGVYAIQDTPPAGWSVANISDDGAFDAVNQIVKWGPFFDNLPRALNYQVTPPANATGTAMFSGQGLFDSTTVPITGQRQTTAVIPFVGSVVSALPSNFVAGVAFPVTDLATPATNILVYAVQDTVPVGWLATNISDNGAFDAPNHVVKWGPYFDTLPRALSYTVLPSANATNTVMFSGTASFDTTAVPITGQRQSVPLLVSPGTAVSSFAPQFTPGQWFTVTNLVTPAANISVFAVQDLPPAGWTVANISDGGSFDAINGEVKWGPFFGGSPVALRYDVLPPIGATGTVTFTGSADFDGLTISITGQRQTTAALIFYGSIASSFPSNFAAGVSFTVTNLAVPATNISAFAVQDTPPAGWTVANISDDGAFDAVNQIVKWGPFFDNLPRALTYQVTPPANATGTVTFSGQGLFDSTTVPITGQRQTTALIPFVGNVVSVLPSNFVASVAFPVTDLATPATNISAYAVQDTVPAGWLATNISDDGAFDPLNHVVKWGPFFDTLPRALSYTVLPPANASNIVAFTGTASFDANIVPITGQRLSARIAGTALVPLLLINYSRLSAGQFQFDFTNAAHQSVTVLVSSNPAAPLSNWSVLGPPALVTGDLYRFIDSAATNQPQRFYRLRSP